MFIFLRLVQYIADCYHQILHVQFDGQAGVWTQSGLFRIPAAGAPASPTASHHVCAWVYWLLQCLWRPCYLFCECEWCRGQDDLSVTLLGHCLMKACPVWRIGLRPMCRPTASRHRRKWGCQRLIKCNFFLSLLPDISSSTLRSVCWKSCTLRCSVCVQNLVLQKPSTVFCNSLCTYSFNLQRRDVCAEDTWKITIEGAVNLYVSDLLLSHITINNNGLKWQVQFEL